jgi:hypothetical protein
LRTDTVYFEGSGATGGGDLLVEPTLRLSEPKARAALEASRPVLPAHTVQQGSRRGVTRPHALLIAGIVLATIVLAILAALLVRGV